MPLSRFEKLVPWSGAVAGLCWIVQSFLFHEDAQDSPGKATTGLIHANLALNYGGVACLVLMGIALTFFATALRSLLRSGEARGATYSDIAYGGLLLMAAGLSQMVMWNWGLINGAADAKDDAALQVLSYVGYFGFAGMGIGIATTFIATGMAGMANTALLPRWFAIVTLVMGILSALGDAGIPPGGLVNYLLLPFWLIAVAVIVARRQKVAAARSLLPLGAG